jgi:hypothetical protein
VAVHIETVEAAFAALRREYRPRKGRAEGAVCEWVWSTSSWYDPRPLHFERNGWPRGRRLREEPTNRYGRVQCGFDDDGRVVVEREYTEYGFYETFYEWNADPVEVAHYDYAPEKKPINLMLVHHADDKPTSSDVSAIGGYTREEYEWSGGRVVAVSVFYAKRERRRLGTLVAWHRAVAQYDARGKVRRVVLRWPPSPPERTRGISEVPFERRGARIHYRG